MSQKQSGQKSHPSAIVLEEWEGKRLDFVTRTAFEMSWGRARNWISRGKIFVEGMVVVDEAFHPPVGANITFVIDASRPKPADQISRDDIAFLDQDFMIVRKPHGLLTVPFEREDRGTLIQQLRSFLAKEMRKAGKKKKKGEMTDKSKEDTSLFVVHRLDRATSGLIVFARSIRARETLQVQFREHSILRRYVAVVHGEVRSQTIRTHLLKDRGDGMRGSREHALSPHVSQDRGGKLAVTHVQVLEKLQNATLIECKLETGRTNQIRIHLSEENHPLVGEKVYMRDFKEKEIVSPRLMLHAAELGFIHPQNGETIHFEEPLPDEMVKLIEKLRIKK